MVYQLHHIALYLHIATGSVALAMFWLPLLGKKGTRQHRQFGRYFVYAMLAVALSGLTMSSLLWINPIAVRAPQSLLDTEVQLEYVERVRAFAAFLFMLSLLVWNNARHAVLVLQAKTQRQHLKSVWHLGVFILQLFSALVVGSVGIQRHQLLLQIFAVLGVVNVFGIFHYIFKRELRPREWILAHIGSIMGTGIGAYTAFLVFGGNRLFSHLLNANGQLFLWTAPGVIGTIATIYLTSKYRRHYRVTAAQSVAG